MNTDARSVSTRGIEPPAGMSREVGLLFAQLEAARRLTRQAVEGMSTARLDATASGFANSIAQLLFHVAGTEYWLIRKLCLGEPISEAVARDFAPSRLGSDDARALRGRDVGFYLGKLDEVRAQTESACWKLDDDDLERTAVHPGDGALWTVRYVLVHLCDHEAHHRGQIEILKRAAGSAAN